MVMWSNRARQVSFKSQSFRTACRASINVFLLSTCHVFLSSGSAKVSQVKSSSNAPKALIIEPSKELAEQTLNNVNQFKKHVDNPKLR